MGDEKTICRGKMVRSKREKENGRKEERREKMKLKEK